MFGGGGVLVVAQGGLVCCPVAPQVTVHTDPRVHGHAVASHLACFAGASTYEHSNKRFCTERRDYSAGPEWPQSRPNGTRSQNNRTTAASRRPYRSYNVRCRCAAGPCQLVTTC